MKNPPKQSGGKMKLGFVLLIAIGVIIAVGVFAMFRTIPFLTQIETSIISKSTSTPVTATSSPVNATNTYDQVILTDHPVAFWDINPKSNTESDLSGHGNTGTYLSSIPSTAVMPNGNTAAKLNGSSQYMTVTSSPAFSISTTGNLTWEAWIRPDTLQFPNGTSDNYVEFIGKCAHHSPTCEWEGRMYDESTLQSGRSNRISAYVFNPTAGLGSGADWQPTSSLIKTGQWVYVVGEYTTQSQPSNCANTSTYPGSINIWVNGVKWNQSYHDTTGCMSQHQIVPQANNSAVNIGTLSLSTWFKGGIGKVAIYNYLLSQAQIDNHYKMMTGSSVTGTCTATCTFK